MTLEEEVAELRAENQALQEALNQTQRQLQVALERIQELEKRKTPPPSFVKANAKKPKTEEKKPRKKRDAKHNQARRRAMPTHIVEHRIAVCPDCDLRLGGVTLARSREVIDIPASPAVQVIEHRIYQGWCAHCHTWHEAPVDFSEQVLGQGRIGVRLASVIAYLRTCMRLPLRQVREAVRNLHGFEVSIGEIVELLHRIREYAQPALEELKGEIRTSPAVQADETGWREDGINGYIWSVSTPQIRYYEYHHSRGGEVVKQLIGDEFQGVLGSDFYAAYTVHQGLHQRCWVHFLRDGHDLKKEFPDDEDLRTWTKQVKALYEQAVAFATTDPDPGLSPRKQQQVRLAQQRHFEHQLWALCQPYVGTNAPQRTFCERVERFLPEATCPGAGHHQG